MKFALPHLENEFEHLHPDVRYAVMDLDKYCLANRMPEVVVTHVLRTAKQNDAIYNGLKKFSWHMCFCAADLRNRHYTRTQLRNLFEYLKSGRDDSRFEILDHDVGRGAHLHIGRRDFEWRSRFTPPPPPKGA